MDTNNSSLKNISKIGLGALAILVAGSFIFFKERVLFADAAYFTFCNLNYSGLAIQHERYGSFITQMIPHIGKYFHLPLTAILIWYSASFYVFYFGVAALLVFGLKQYRLAILAALYYFLFFSDSYFWVSEIPQGVGWLLLFFGVCIYMCEKKVPFLLILIPFVILAFLSITSHFVILMPLVFLWVYFILEKDNWPFSGGKTTFFSIILALVFVGKFLFAMSGTRSNDYDAQHLHGIMHVSFKDIFNSFRTPVVRMFLYRCIVNYWAGTLILAVGVISLFRRGKTLLAAWTLASCLGYIMVMGLTYGDLDEHVLLFHIESEWTGIGIIIATPFVFSFLPKIKIATASAFLSAVFVVRLAYISSALSLFSWHIHFNEDILARMRTKGITKLAIYQKDRFRSQYLLDWATCYESLLASAIDGDKPTRTFAFIDEANNSDMVHSLTTDKEGFCSPWGITPAKDLNQRYFFMDTSAVYQVMHYDDLLK